MQYGHFDDKAREYVIDRPDTPTSWSNYLGSRKYGGVITNNAGGYGFYRSPANGRLLRLLFNAIPMDQPGRYLYLRDEDNGDFWSASWQPVGKPLDEYQSTCRFGTGYAVIDSQYAGIRSETTYFVPVDQSFEYWKVRLTNEGDTARSLSLYTYVEFASEWNFKQDQHNIQYTAYTVRADLEGGFVRCASLNNLPPVDDFNQGEQGRWTWLTVVGADLLDYDLDRAAFIGPYRDYGNPLAVEEGKCSNSYAYGDTACGALRTSVSLAPGETRELLIMMGVGKAEEEGKQTVAAWGDLGRCDRALAELKQLWHGRLESFQCETPDEDFNHMINVWNAYNAQMTFEWSRACSLVYTGDSRDGYGFRDTVQDIVGITHSIPELAGQRLELMLSGQESTGGAKPVIDPVSHTPGKMTPTAPDLYRSDDCLWFFDSIPAYVTETGDVDFYQKVIPYSDTGEATVFGHLRRALEFNLERTGMHGLPCGLHADWNDCLRLGFKGETIFVTFQLRHGLRILAEIGDMIGEEASAAWARAELEKLDARIQEHAWDGDWFVRAYRDDGSVIGAKENDEGRIFLNSQSWAVISGAATDEQASRAMASVDEHLASDFGIAVCVPPFEKVDFHVVRAVLMNPGQKENGGIFSHPQGWAIMADCMLGEGDRAYRHYCDYMPAKYNDRAELRRIEPYVHCQSSDAPASRNPGVSHVPWLSGTAAWSYFAAVQYILGIRPEVDGLKIDPCIPSAWDGFSVHRVFRGKSIDITVRNGKKGKGVKSLTVNGATIDGDVIPVSMLADENAVEVELV